MKLLKFKLIFVILLSGLPALADEVIEGGVFTEEKSSQPLENLGGKSGETLPTEQFYSSERQANAPVNKTLFVVGDDGVCYYGNFKVLDSKKVLVVYHNSAVPLENCVYQKKFTSDPSGFAIFERKGGVCKPVYADSVEDMRRDRDGLKEINNVVSIIYCTDKTVSFGLNYHPPKQKLAKPEILVRNIAIEKPVEKKPEVKVEPKPEPIAEPKPVMVTAEIKPEIKPELKPEIKPEIKVETEVKVETKPEVKLPEKLPEKVVEKAVEKAVEKPVIEVKKKTAEHKAKKPKTKLKITENKKHKKKTREVETENKKESFSFSEALANFKNRVVEKYNEKFGEKPKPKTELADEDDLDESEKDVWDEDTTKKETPKTPAKKVAKATKPKRSTATTSSKQHYTIQVGSYATEDEAKKASQQISSLDDNLEPFHYSAEVNEKTWFRVAVGKYDSFKEAKEGLSQVKSMVKGPAFIQVIEPKDFPAE